MGTGPTLKLRHGLSSQGIPVTDGALILRTDTEQLEIDIGGERHSISEVVVAPVLPMAPVVGKLYLSNGSLLTHVNGDWVKLNVATDTVRAVLGIDPDTGGGYKFLNQKGVFTETPGLTEDEVIALIMALS